MTALIVYDSKYGNTQKIAEAIGSVFGQGGRVVHVDDFNPEMLKGVDILIVGSPIHGWRPSEPTKKFLDKLKGQNLSGMAAAAFDTRLKSIFSGNAARRIAQVLKQAGCQVVVPPQGFIVSGSEGPLAEGELDRAKDWTKQVIDASGQPATRRIA
ncbi:MAG: flavodoxin family protein [Firmicutes bacterium]|nr:flavodoxin family protein [Bacillota bacterium]